MCIKFQKYILTFLSTSLILAQPLCVCFLFIYVSFFYFHCFCFSLLAYQSQSQLVINGKAFAGVIKNTSDLLQNKPAVVSCCTSFR